MVKNFLPEWFFESEHDGIKLFMLSSRLTSKVCTHMVRISSSNEM